MNNEIIDPNAPIIERLVKVNGIAFEEQFVAKVIAEHLSKESNKKRYYFSDALRIYTAESLSACSHRFIADTNRNFNYFLQLFGDVELTELRHWHITAFRDFQLRRGLKP